MYIYIYISYPISDNICKVVLIIPTFEFDGGTSTEWHLQGRAHEESAEDRPFPVRGATLL